MAVVDEDDYDRVKDYPWRISPNGYVVAHVGNGVTLLLHRMIMSPENNQVVDHKHHDKLDNRKSELVVTTRTGNQGNRRKGKGTTSQFKGVYWDKRKGRWHAKITVIGGRKHLGYFDGESDAAEAYNRAAAHYFGDRALLNSV